MQQFSMIYNRLVKNKKKLKSYLNKHSICAYRLYDKDIPEYPYIIDIYDQNAIVFEKGKRIDLDETELLKKSEQTKEEITFALRELLSIDPQKIIFKERQVQKGIEQYKKIAKSDAFFTVKEGPLKFRVNLNDYLDTGLFLDHRPLRESLLARETKGRVLNLFAYTGSLSVAAAFSGAKVITVDMSKTYIEWAKANFELNGIDSTKHIFIQADVLKFIEDLSNPFDLILLDPPSFSNSKRMDQTFVVQRDHEELINKLMKYLSPSGRLIFSNNNRKFKLAQSLYENFSVKDITEKSIPLDFRDNRIHCCFEIKKAP